MSLIPIVDADDTIIEYVERNDGKPEQRYRVSALWVTNSQGEILLAQRSHTKKHHPLLWGPAVAGTVEKDETYEQNIIKETEEELGIKNISPVISHKTKTTSNYLHFTQWFTLTLDLPLDSFSLEESEVEQLKWLTPGKLQSDLLHYPERFVPGLSLVLPLFLPNSHNS